MFVPFSYISEITFYIIVRFFLLWKKEIISPGEAAARNQKNIFTVFTILKLCDSISTVKEGFTKNKGEGKLMKLEVKDLRKSFGDKEDEPETSAKAY